MLQGTTKLPWSFSHHPAATGTFFTFMLLGLKFCSCQSQGNLQNFRTGLQLLEDRIYRYLQLTLFLSASIYSILVVFSLIFLFGGVISFYFLLSLSPFLFQSTAFLLFFPWFFFLDESFLFNSCFPCLPLSFNLQLFSCFFFDIDKSLTYFLVPLNY